MATLPTATECRNYLEGYGIDSEVISKDWIEDERDNSVVPIVEDIIGRSISVEETIVDYVSGNNTDILILNRREINSIVQLELISGPDIDGTININSVELLPKKGILKAVAGLEQYRHTRTFPKGENNIKVTYKVGGTLDDRIAMAIKQLVCVAILDNIEGRTGGGSLTVQGFGRQYGNMGKYSNIRKRLSNKAMVLLRKYKTSVVGS